MPAKRSYPSSSFPEALQRMRLLYEAEPHNEMTSDAAAQHLGYRGKNGASLTAIATMRRYGLIEGRGEKIKVSRDAVTIFADEHAENQDERIDAIARCAYLPEMFAEIVNAFPNTPALPTLVSFLIKRGLSTNEATEVAERYKETDQFVGSVSSEYNSAQKQDALPTERQMTATTAALPAPQTMQGARNIQIPLSASTWANLSAPFPLTKEAWKQMLDVLNAMKPALVLPDHLSVPAATSES